MITGTRAGGLLRVKVEQTETLWSEHAWLAEESISVVIFADQDVCGTVDLVFGDSNSVKEGECLLYSAKVPVSGHHGGTCFSFLSNSQELVLV